MKWVITFFVLSGLITMATLVVNAAVVLLWELRGMIIDDYRVPLVIGITVFMNLTRDMVSKMIPQTRPEAGDFLFSFSVLMAVFCLLWLVISVIYIAMGSNEVIFGLISLFIFSWIRDEWKELN